jgi:hypothetical protein
VTELLGIGDCANRLHQPVGDVERDGQDDPSVIVEEQGSGLSVKFHEAKLRGTQLFPPATKAAHQPAHTFTPMHRVQERGGLPSAVAVRDDVSREQLNESLGVSISDRLEEPLGELGATSPRGLEAGLPRVDLTAGSNGDLPAVRLALADDPGDLTVAVLEHLPKDEDRPLDRTQALKQHQQRHRERIGRLHLLGDVE